METKPSEYVQKLEEKNRSWWWTILRVLRDVVITLIGFDWILF